MNTKSITLTASETSEWESSESFRAELRDRLESDAAPGAHIEVYSDDGVTLDAWDVESAPLPLDD